MTDTNAPAWVPDLIQARTAAAPEAVALRTDHDEITYADLWRRSHETRRSLSALAVGAGDIVAVHLPPGPDVIVAMLATWLAGAAFLPMDAAIPDGYRSHLLRDSAAAAVFDRAGGPTALDVAGDGAPAERPPAAPADRPAYVIYTSGSTGTPKGVLVGHRALAGHTTAIAGLLDLDHNDTVLQFASIGFDVAQEEIWPTLAAGGTLALRRAATVDAEGLAAYARDLGVSVLQLPTAYWRLVCAETQGTTDPSYAHVRTVVIGGESATANDVHVHRNGPLGHCTLVNGYGPTEAVITATALALRPDQAVPSSTGLPIGVPVGERLLYVLDAGHRPVAHDVPGELWIGGRPLADGYLNDPVRTADRFRPDPFADDARARMYRTGDLVVRHQDGHLEFLGRLDNQVKVRGHRIELEEVDRHLLDTPGITAAASITLEDGTGGQMLGAGISRIPDGPTAEEIRDRLRRHLPAHMVPGPIFVFDRLPLTVYGKIDRRAVASLAAAGHLAAPADESLYDERQTPVADQLVALLRDLLRAPGFGPDDDFVAHGGDSLIALRVSGTMKERGWRLRPSELIAERTARRAAQRAGPLVAPRATRWT
jgi:amino acid adenylation domain-containing protein